MRILVSALALVLCAGDASAQRRSPRLLQQGALTANDPKLPDGSYYDDYPVTALAGQWIEVRLSSTAFDTYLALGRITASGFVNLQANDDSGPGTTNSYLRVQAPAAGTYYVRVNSLAAAQVGTYQLSVSVTN